MQYYVPSLSAIQLYTHLSGPNIGTRRPGEESDASDDYRDTGNEGSSSDEAERDSKYGGAIEVTLKLHKKAFLVMMVKEAVALHFNILSEQLHIVVSLWLTKIEDLAKDFPQLKTLRSIDLLPTSWLSVAWYPIYRIPTGPTLRDLAACFLTFHSLSTPL